MTCGKCGSTWSAGAGVASKAVVCPFCGESLVENAAPAAKVSAGEALRICVEDKTVEALLNRSLVLAYLTDLGTGFNTNDKRAILVAIDDGIAAIFVNATKEENPNKVLAITKARRNLREMLNEAKTKFVLDCFCLALGWQSELSTLESEPEATRGDVALIQTAPKSVGSGVPQNGVPQRRGRAEEQPFNISARETTHVRELFDDVYIDENISFQNASGFFSSPSAKYWEIRKTYYSSGREEDKKLALQEFTSPVLFHHGPSATLVGYMYEKGIGIPADPVRALKAYERGAQAGCVTGVFNLGLCYLYGKGTAKNEKKAFQYISFAAEHGFVVRGLLAELYQKGIGTPVDLKKAAEWAKKNVVFKPPEKNKSSARENFARAMRELLAKDELMKNE